MISLFLSFVSYLIAVFFHVLIHRYLVRIGKKTFASVGVFLFGLILHAVIAFRFSELPSTSIVLYGLLSWLHIIIFTESYYGDMGPSRKILSTLRTQGSMREKEIIDCFSNQVLIGNRLDHLCDDGLVLKKNGRYFPSPKGARLHHWLEQYRQLLNWQSSG